MKRINKVLILKRKPKTKINKFFVLEFKIKKTSQCSKNFIKFQNLTTRH